MNQIISSVCALAFVSSYACAQPVTCVKQVTCVKPATSCKQVVYIQLQEPCAPPPLKVNRQCYDSYREPYRICYPHVCPTMELRPVITNTDVALATRQAAIIRQREIIRFERAMLAASTPITQPSSTGTTIFGETEGAGVFDKGCAPIPPAYPGTPAAAPGRKVVLAPVAESAVDVIPLARLAPDRPGCVYSPFGQNAGYIDVQGLTSGSLAKDPYTGRVFRVP